MAGIDILAVLHIHVLVQIHAADELLGGVTGRDRLVVVRKVDIVADAVHHGLKILPFAVILPLPLVFEGGSTVVVAEVAVQNVHAGIEAFTEAIVQSGGNRIVSTNPGGGFAGILNRYDLVDVVRGLGLAVGVFFSLSGADDGHENLISLIRYKTGMVFIALLLDQFDFYAAGSKCVRGTVRVGEVRERCAHDGDGDQRHAQENCGDFLLHDVLLLIIIVFSAPARRELLRHWRQPMRQQHQPCRPSGQRRP